MGKLRIYELAKQLKITSKELIELLTEMGIKVKNHMSTLDNATVKRVLASLGESEPVPDPEPHLETEAEEPVRKTGGKIKDKAVSYTHLDVYKRQVLSLKSLPTAKAILSLA